MDRWGVGGHQFSKPRTAGIVKMVDTVTLSTQKGTHIGWLLVRAQRSNGTVSATIRDTAAVASSCETRNTSSHSAGRRETRGHQGEDAASLLAFLVACLRARPTRLAKYQPRLPASVLSCLSYLLFLSDRVKVTFL